MTGADRGAFELDRRAVAWWTRASPDALGARDVSDPVIAASSDADRLVLAEIWQKRAGFELQVAAGFSSIATSMFEVGAAPPVVKIVGRAVRDEIRHAEISAELAARYRQSETVWPGAVPVHVPQFAPATGALRLALYFVAMCCINETVACSVLEASIARGKSPLVRAAQQAILEDEIDHARAGWAHLASTWVTSEIKAELSEWLYRMLKAKMRELVEDESPLPGEALPDHGMLSRADTRRVVRGALMDVIFPGFDAAGVDTARSRQWADEALPA